MTRSDGIHQDFRIFATANMHRAHSHRLSSALLNRVIRIWLPALDSLACYQAAGSASPQLASETTPGKANGLSAPLKRKAASTPASLACDDQQLNLLPIIAEHLDGVPARRELSLLAVQTHLHVQVKPRIGGQDTLITGVSGLSVHHMAMQPCQLTWHCRASCFVPVSLLQPMSCN